MFEPIADFDRQILNCVSPDLMKIEAFLLMNRLLRFVSVAVRDMVRGKWENVK